jgi:hypothetical protein
MIEWEYCHKSKPRHDLPGYYATLYSWETYEGGWNEVNYWDGQNWKDRMPVIAFAGPFETEYKAHEWMCDNENDF